MKYENYHKHTHYSNIKTLDCVVKPEDYMKRAVELGHKTYFTTEHGYQGNIYEANTLCKKYDLKLIVGCEVYYVKDRHEKDNSNYHMIIICLNNEGYKELNKVLSISNVDGYYYKNRIDDELLFSINPNNFIITTACVGGRLRNKEGLDDWVIKMKNYFKNNFYLETQYHKDSLQIEMNKFILELSSKYDIKFIHGNDSHYIYYADKKEFDTVIINNKEYKLLPANRDLFLKAKGIVYNEESEFVLDYPDYETIIEKYKVQGVLNQNQIIESIENTNVFDKCEKIDINNDIKMPNISKDSNKELRDIINEKWKLEKHNIPLDRQKEYIKAIKEEMEIIKKTNMEEYFIINYKMIKRAVEEYNGIITKTGRGSAPSFYVNKSLNFTDLDRLNSPIKLFPTRFMSVERILGSKSLPDIDFNTANPEPFVKASKDLLGDDGCQWMISYKPLQESSAFRLYCKAIGMEIGDYNEIAKQLDNYKTHSEWGKVIQASQDFVGVIESISQSPCSTLLLDKPISEEIGLVKAGDIICCNIDGYNCDVYKYLKNDLLTVSVWSIINDTCELANIKTPSIRELTELLDDKTYDMYKLGLTCTLNQVDSDFATPLVQRYAPRTIDEMSAFVAAIRPGFASLKENFLSRNEYTTGIAELDNILKDSYHYMLYQESIMSYLTWLGIKESETYDIIKKIAKKKFKEAELEALKSKLKQSWKDLVGKEEGFNETWQVVEDAAHYSFNACVSGNTKIQRAGLNNKFEPTIEEMYLIRNNYGYAKENGHLSLYNKYRCKGYGNALSMFDDNRVRINKIIDIRKSGVRDIYRVKVNTGEYLDCTMNHKFPTPIGEIKLEDLKLNDELFVIADYEKHPDNYRFTDGNYKTNYPKLGQHGFQKIPNGNSVLFHSIMNEKKISKTICKICEKKYNEKDKFELHHKDLNRSNNEKFNLIWLCNSCHKKEHYKSGRKKVYEKGIPIKISKIISIEYIKTEMTYDIEMQDPAHNFISKSGLITCNSHSLSYAYDSLYGAYLKSHYSLEYYTVALNNYINDIDRTHKLFQELKYFNINLSSPKFRYSSNQYTLDKKTNTIFKGVSSIKGISKNVGEQLNQLKNNVYDTFLDLLCDLKPNHIHISDILILIKLDYFSEFGKIKKLLKYMDIFQQFFNAKTFNKGKSYLVKFLVIKKFCDKETAKQYKEFRDIEFLNYTWSKLPDEDISTKEKIKYELEYYGYIDTIDKTIDDRLWCVISTELRGNNYITHLQNINNGKQETCKIRKRIYQDNKIEKSDFILLRGFSSEGVRYKDGDDWKQSEEVFENILKEYKKV